MNATERQAIAEVLESYFEPDSPEALAFAMYQLRRIYNAQKTAPKNRRRPKLLKLKLQAA